MEKKIHPLVTQANQQLREGKISRRDFLRLSTLLGLTLAGAEVLAACGTPEQVANDKNSVTGQWLKKVLK